MPAGLKTAIAVIILWSLSGFAQDQTDDTRSLRPREYSERRVQDSISQKRLKSRKKRPRIIYAPVGDNDTPVAEGVDVGVTFWRLRRVKRTDPSEWQEVKRILVETDGKSEKKLVNVIPVRAKSETVFSEGDLLRLTIEPPFESYVYIISREQYKDGSYSDPYFIFPAKSAAGLSNKGSPGRLLFLPSEVRVFEIKRLNSDKAEKIAEWITIILSRKPFEELQPLEDDELVRRIDKQKFEGWRNEWIGPVWRFEMQDEVGSSITGREKNAGAKVGAKLNGGDPLPQTVYHIGRKSTDVVLFDLALRIGK